MSDASEQLSELEVRVALLIRKYSEVKQALAQKREECEALLANQARQEERIKHLEQNLSIVAVASGTSPDARVALEGLSRELQGITEVIDECITLLDSRIE